MNSITDFDRIAQSWLQDGPTELPDRSLQAALDEVHVTSQQRFGAARRTFHMNGNASRLAVAAVIGLLVLIGGGIYLGNTSSGGVGSQSAPTRSAAPTPTPKSVLAPPLVPETGLIPPGTYRLASTGQVGPVAATLSVALPAGWATGAGKWVVVKDTDTGPALGVWQISDRFKQPCTDHTLYSSVPATGIDELLTTLASQPGITARPITDVTVGGFAGKVLELTVATDIATCPVDVGDDPLSGFWLWASPDGDRKYVQGSDETYRIYAVDVDGSRFTFFARIPAQSTPTERAELQAIIDSIAIEPTASVSPSP